MVYLEFSIEDETYYPWQKDIFNGNPFEVTDGSLKLQQIQVGE